MLAFCFSSKGDTDEEINDSWVSTFYRIVSGINGLCFFLLTVVLLNYGSRLEKIVHEIKVRGLQQQVRGRNNLQDYIGVSGSSTNNTFNFGNGDIAHELTNQGVENHQNKLLSNLDVRIFIVTIFLSVVLLSISVTELLCCFKIIRDVTTLAEWKFLLYYLLSESMPSLTIACFLNSSNERKLNASAVNEASYSAGQNQSHSEKKGRRARGSASRRSDSNLNNSNVDM